MIYAKFTSRTQLEYAPNPITINGKDIFTTDPTPYGYKQVITTQPSGELTEGYYWSPYWVENDADITQAWEQKAIEPSEPTDFDKVEAQVTYTALMTDTLLEEEE